MMKVVLGLFLMSIALLGLPTKTCAMRWVICEMQVSEDRERNVKEEVFGLGKQVRDREAERLVASGPYDYIIRYDRGNYCVIRHRENSRYFWRVYKPSMKLDPAGRVPNCTDYTIRSLCGYVDVD